MGVPKFYRFISERYPLVNLPLEGLPGGAPVIDNLYLDMNGVIHNCSHGNGDINTRVTEESIMVKVFAYLDQLVQITRPTTLVYMAIDGVAPRAKMNQQRTRRFRSARDAAEALEAARRRGEDVNPDPFDSNCITPGTEFMAHLSKHLQFFVRKKQSEDPTWRAPTVILSGPEVHGEGEHKIMEHIRWARLQPTWKPDQRHCMYGLDADLIMLALVTHEPNFCLLREVVKFGGGSRGQPSREVLENPTEDGFILFQIGLLRDYLDLEFRPVAQGLPFEYNLERCIDDFVFICMLVGNDFLPHLPTLDIAEGALNMLFDLYRELLPSLGGYLNNAGELDARRLETFLSHVATRERDILVARAKDAEKFATKQEKMEMRENKRRGAAVMQPDASSGSQPEEDKQSKPSMMSSERRDMLLDETGGGIDTWKASYYREKMGMSVQQGSPLLRNAYLEGLRWVLHYYYRGVPSWGWFYPFHYAPMASDMVGLAQVPNHGFVLGAPFRPFEQLLSVLPPRSSKLLPEPFRRLMLEPNSPILDFYPEDFKLDMEGKRNDWEGVVLVPFIDAERLLAAAASINQRPLTKAEVARNLPGVNNYFRFDRKCMDEVQSTLPRVFAGLFPALSKMALVKPPPLALPPESEGFGVTFPGKRQPAPGFPTLRTLRVAGRSQVAGVMVFSSPSKKESLVLRLMDVGDASVTARLVAPAIVGSRVFVNWPYLQEAVVVAVSDEKERVDAKGPRPLAEGARAWQDVAAKVAGDYLTKKGVDTGRMGVIVHCQMCEGLVKHSDGSLQKRFAKEETPVPLQAVLRRNPAPDPRLVEKSAGEVEAIKPGTTCLFMGSAYFGAICEVLQKSEGSKGLVVCVTPPSPTAEGNAKRILQGVQARFEPSGAIARKLGINPRVLGQLTGSVWIDVDADVRIDVGLNLKHAQQGLCVPDYCRPTKEDNGWEYSQLTTRLAEQYKARFPWIFQALQDNLDDAHSGLKLVKIFPSTAQTEAMRTVYEARDWLKKQPAGRRPLVNKTSVCASEEAIQVLAASTPPSPRLPSINLESVSQELLLTPATGDVVLSIAGGNFELGDRVVMVADSGRAPFGLRGAVVGLHGKAVEVLFDEVFVGGEDLHGRIPDKRGALVPCRELLNLTDPPAAALKANGMAKTRAKSGRGRKGGAQDAAPATNNWEGGVSDKVITAPVPAPVPSAQQAAAARKAAADALKGKAKPRQTDASGAAAGAQLLALLQKGAAGAAPAPAPVPAPAATPTVLRRPPAGDAGSGQALLQMLQKGAAGGAPQASPPPPSNAVPLAELEGKLSKMDTKDDAKTASQQGNAAAAFIALMSGAATGPLPPMPTPQDGAVIATPAEPERTAADDEDEALARKLQEEEAKLAGDDPADFWLKLQAEHSNDPSGEGGDSFKPAGKRRNRKGGKGPKESSS